MQGFDKTASVTQIQADLGLVSGDAAYGLIGNIWDSYADKLAVGPRLQFLYTERQAITVTMGADRKLVDVTDEDQGAKLHQRIDTLETLLGIVQDEIERIEKRASANRAVVVAQPTAVSITPRTVTTFDPSDPAYRGSPSARRPGGYP